MKKLAAMFMIALVATAFSLFMIGCSTSQQSNTESTPAETEQHMDMEHGGMDTSMTDTTMTHGDMGGE